MFSSRNLISAGLLLALVASFVAGALLQPFGETPSATDVASARTALNAAEASGASGSDRGAVGRIDRSADPAPQLSPGADLSPQQLAAIVTAVESVEGEPAPPRSLEAGQFSATGSVATQNGMPLADVVIRALPANLHYFDWDQKILRRDPRGAAEPRTMESALRQAAESFRKAAQQEIEVRSDATGAFLLNGLQRGVPYFVEARKEGYAITDGSHSHWVVMESPTHLRLVARILVRVPVRIETAAKELMDHAGVAVESTSDDWSLPCYWERSRPEIWIPPGQYRIHAYQVENSELITPSETLLVAEGTELPEVLLSFPKMARIVGMMRGAAMNPPERQALSVRALPYEDGAAIEDGYCAWNGTGGFILNPAGPSRFQIEELTLGKHSLVVLLGSNRVIYRQELEILEGLNEVDIDLKELSGDRVIEVHVEDPFGRGIPDLQLYAESNEIEEETNVEAVAMDITGSRWSLIHAASDLEKSRQWTLHAHAPTYGQIVREYDPFSEERLLLRFEPVARLEVHLPQSNGAELNIMKLVTGSSNQDGPLAQTSLTFDESDRARSGPIAPGRYRLQVSVESSDWLTLIIHNHDCDLLSGDNQVTLSMPQLSSLALSIPERDTTEEVLAMTYPTLDGVRKDVKLLLNNEKFVLDRLPPGHYAFAVQSRRGKTTRKLEVDLPGPSVLSFPRQAEAGISNLGIELTEFAPNARALQLGLRSSDVLISIAGHSLRNPEVGAAILIAAPHVLPGDSFAVEIMRGGQRIELNLPRELFLDPAVLGLKR